MNDENGCAKEVVSEVREWLNKLSNEIDRVEKIGTLINDRVSSVLSAEQLSIEKEKTEGVVADKALCPLATELRSNTYRLGSIAIACDYMLSRLEL